MRLRVYCEGDTDKPVAKKVVQACGHEVREVVALGGHGPIDTLIRNFSATPPRDLSLVLRDVDPTPPNRRGQRYRQCAPGLLETLGVPNRGPNFLFRLARHEVEAWLLADHQALARWLGCSVGRFPRYPDEELKPSLTIVKLARGRNVKRDRRAQLVPRQGALTSFGPGYEAAVIDFAAGPWSPVRARARSPSLARCMVALEGLSGTAP